MSPRNEHPPMSFEEAASILGQCTRREHVAAPFADDRTMRWENHYGVLIADGYKSKIYKKGERPRGEFDRVTIYRNERSQALGTPAIRAEFFADDARKLFECGTAMRHIRKRTPDQESSRLAPD